MITLNPPKVADIPACRPEESTIITATANVAISWTLSILLKTSNDFDADNDLNPINF